MKKQILAVVTGVLAAGMLLTACGGNHKQDVAQQGSSAQPGSGAVVPSSADQGDGALLGGWTVAEPGISSLSEEEQAIFDKAKEQLLGVDYTPVAVLATQLVSGTNYAFLSSGKVVVPDSKPSWKIVTVYADLSGNVSVLNVADVELTDISVTDDVQDPMIVGAWQLREPADAQTVLDETAQAAFDKAAAGYTGVGLKPIALLGTQVVAGMNYKVLCYGTMVTAEPVSALYVADVYEDLEGNAEFSNVQKMDLMDYIEASE